MTAGCCSASEPFHKRQREIAAEEDVRLFDTAAQSYGFLSRYVKELLPQIEAKRSMYSARAEGYGDASEAFVDAAVNRYCLLLILKSSLAVVDNKARHNALDPLMVQLSLGTPWSASQIKRAFWDGILHLKLAAVEGVVLGSLANSLLFRNCLIPLERTMARCRGCMHPDCLAPASEADPLRTRCMEHIDHSFSAEEWAEVRDWLLIEDPINTSAI